jgi:putative endonuclease
MAWVYILTNRPNGTLYVGVTKDLIRRIYEHRSGNVDSFSRKHGLKRLVYSEEHATVPLAIQREKYETLATINGKNREWHDLFDEIV